MGHTHAVFDGDTRFVIDAATRTIKSESSGKAAVMQYDHNSERLTFEVPRYIEKHDMSLCNRVEVHYLNIESGTRKEHSGVYVVNDLFISPDDENIVVCSWLVSQNATQYNGKLNFLLRFCCVEDGVIEYSWNTAVYSGLTVSEGIDASGMFETEYVEIIERWKASVMAHFTADLTAWKQDTTDGLTEWEAETEREIRSAASDEIAGNYAKWSSELAAERSRIDAFVALEDGSTTGDAELQDIRIGADGTTYASAGTAVREQARTKVSNLVSPDRLVSGGYISATGSVVSNSAFSYVESAVIPGTVISYKYSDNSAAARLALYSRDGAMVANHLGSNVAQYITVPDNACLLRATYNDKSELSLVSDIADVVNAIDALAKNSADLNETRIDHYLVSELVEGAYIRISDGGIAKHTAYSYVEMPAIPCATVKYTYDSNQSIAGLVFYDADNKYIDSKVALKGTQEIVVPENAVTIRATAKTADAVTVANSAREIAQGISLLAKRIATLNKTNLAPTIHVPSKSVAVVGHEWNMYFDNVIRCDNINNYDIQCSISPGLSSWSIYGEWLRINPTKAGAHTVTVSVCEKQTNTALASASFTLHVIEDAKVENKSVIFIGDSLTDTCYYPAEIQHNLSAGGIVSLGTRTETVNIDGKILTVSHEGRAGWSTRDYFTAEAHDMENAFYNPETSTFDFSHYMRSQGYSNVDAVSIFLGTNGVHYEDNVDNLKAMIASIHEYDANIVVLINLINMPATQDGLGYRGFTSTANSFKYDAMNLNDSYIANFDGVLENVDVSEVYFALDTKRDYGTISIPASARNPVHITVQTNNVHPNSLGYLKFADVIYNNLLYHLTKN